MNIEDYKTENVTERRCKGKATTTAAKKFYVFF